MKSFKDWSYRSKTAFIGLSIGLIVIMIIIGMLAMTTTNRIRQGNRNSLELLTEQILVNFSTATDDTVRNVYTMYTASGIPGELLSMRNLDPSGVEYMLKTRDVTNLLMYMVSSSSPYDRVSVLPDSSRLLIHSDSEDREAICEAETIFSEKENRENAYNKVGWVRLDNGSIWLIRDVYNPSPVRHVAKLAARVRPDKLISIGEQNASRHITVLFYNENNELFTAVGEHSDQMAETARSVLIAPSDTIRIGNVDYAVSLQQNNKWKAVGLQPMSIVDELNRHITRIAILAAFIAILAALFLSWIASRGTSSRINGLVKSMNRVSKGDLEVQVPVDSQDEIGELGTHFNNMTGEIKNLLDELVREETEKQQAEYQNIEYEYRFLQWQVNPHFIYNALETVNGLAKIDGNADVCDMIQSLSGYFRQNAETMRKRFVTVRQELRSLRQYVDIYRRIYGTDLQVEYVYDGDAGRAYLPTMTVQPLLENALVHGVKAGKEAMIRVVAETAEDKLTVRIEDNGPGMTEETIARLLGPRIDNPQNKEEKTSLGVRNVLDRLELLFGDQAGLTVRSVPGEGTTVTMTLPLSFTEWTDDLLKH